MYAYLNHFAIHLEHNILNHLYSNIKKIFLKRSCELRQSSWRKFPSLPPSGGSQSVRNMGRDLGNSQSGPGGSDGGKNQLVELGFRHVTVFSFSKCPNSLQ